MGKYFFIIKNVPITIHGSIKRKLVEKNQISIGDTEQTESFIKGIM